MKALLCLLAVMLTPLPALAETILLPRLKPAAVRNMGRLAIILPKLKPERAVPKPPAVEPEQPEKLVPAMAIRFPGSTEGYPRDQVHAARRTCMEKLKGLDFDFDAMAPIGTAGGCGTAAPLLLKSIAGVAVEPPAEANCDLAEALHHWVAWSVKPAAAKYLGKKLVVIRNASAYACRRRNNSSSGKMSEHAIVNALDISTLGFDDGSSISIKGDWTGLKQLVGLSDKGAFLRTVREYACIRFTTVLGPGSDPYHGDHFHVDLARRKGGYRICQ